MYQVYLLGHVCKERNNKAKAQRVQELVLAEQQLRSLKTKTSVAKLFGESNENQNLLRKSWDDTPRKEMAGEV